jgi:hypothetical protein
MIEQNSVIRMKVVRNESPSPEKRQKGRRMRGMIAKIQLTMVITFFFYILGMLYFINENIELKKTVESSTQKLDYTNERMDIIQQELQSHKIQISFLYMERAAQYSSESADDLRLEKIYRKMLDRTSPSTKR